jgi:hypothetical protein
VEEREGEGEGVERAMECWGVCSGMSTGAFGCCKFEEDSTDRDCSGELLLMGYCGWGDICTVNRVRVFEGTCMCVCL